jgi:hypothetical protein
MTSMSSWCRFGVTAHRPQGQGRERLTTMMNVQDVLVVTSVAEPTYRIYAHMAAALQVSTSALIRHVLTGVASTLAAATDQAEREAEGTVPANLQLYGALVRGDMVMGGETRCELSIEAVRVHAHLAQTLARTQELLQRAADTYARAQEALARAQTPPAAQILTP